MGLKAGSELPSGSRALDESPEAGQGRCYTPARQRSRGDADPPSTDHLTLFGEAGGAP